jgi:putative SOS response-associated peptidase YedK
MEGFYEKKVLFTNSNPEEMVVAAGLYDDWLGAEKEFHSCTMITTEPNEVIAELHHRMPALLGPESWDAWLSPGAAKEDLIALLRPAPTEWLIGNLP